MQVWSGYAAGVMSGTRIITSSRDETEAAGRLLGRFLKGRAGAGVVLLYGDLGAGKTTFIKGIASAFGIPERDIGSASFVIAAEYETSPPFHHIDLYRLERMDDIEDLGIEEYFGSGISVVEWAERLPVLPEGSIKVRLEYLEEESREILIEGVPENLPGIKENI